MDKRSTAPALERPPDAADRFRTDDLDELRSYLSSRYGAQVRQALGRGRLGYELSRLRCGTVEINWISQQLAQLARGDAGACVVHVPLCGNLRYTLGRRTAEVSCGEARFVVPGQQYSVRSEPGAYVAVGLPAERVEQELRPYLARPDLRWQPRACTVLMAGPAAMQFQLRFAALVRAASVPAADLRRISLEHAQSGLLEWLGKNLAVSGGVQRVTPLSANRADVLEEWIASHLHEPITLGRLCEVAGVGARSLQKTFGLRHGMPPTQFIVERRLDAVRARLQQPEAELLITRVAMECGFTHMGRFAILFRQRFGESPSATRRRARVRSA